MSQKVRQLSPGPVAARGRVSFSQALTARLELSRRGHSPVENSNGLILWEGCSKLDGSPIAVIAVGLDSDSTNRKTGAMVQTYIIRSDVHPLRAIATGADKAICGNCPARGKIIVQAGNVPLNVGRTCYVEVGRGASMVYGCYIRGGYRHAKRSELRAISRGRLIRFGTYGDPAAAPFWVWSDLAAAAVGITGYTHQWKRFPELRGLVMASVDSEAESSEARASGWRTFRVGAPGNMTRMHGEALCPASFEAGKKLTCADCLSCDGLKTGRRGSIYIPGHGGAPVKKNLRARYAIA